MGGRNRDAVLDSYNRHVPLVGEEAFYHGPGLASWFHEAVISRSDAYTPAIRSIRSEEVKGLQLGAVFAEGCGDRDNPVLRAYGWLEFVSTSRFARGLVESFEVA